MNQSSRRLEIGSTVVLQGLGSLAAFTCVLLLARTLGPGPQGVFSTSKAGIDFLTTLLLLGLPQSLLFYLRTNGKSLTTCLAVVVVHGAGAGGLVWLWCLGSPFADWAHQVGSPELIASTIALCVVYSDLRAISLARHSSAVFSAFSALPNLLLMVLVVVWLLMNHDTTALTATTPIAWFLSVYGASAVAVWVAVTPRGAPTEFMGIIEHLRSLLAYGLYTWVPSMVQSAIIFLTLQRVAGQENIEAVGAFGVALTLVATAITPLSLVVPLLFKWWIPLDPWRRVSDAMTSAVTAFAGCVLLWILYVLVDVSLIRAVFGESYVPYAGLYTLMLATVGPQAVMRLFGVYCNSAGKPAVAALTEVARAVAIAGGIFVLGDRLHSIALAWIGGEALALVICAFVLTTDRARLRSAR